MNHSEAVSQMAAELYLLDELGPDVRDEFEEHLFDCPECVVDVRAGDMFLREGKAQLPALVAEDEARARESRAVVEPVKAKRDWFGWLRPAYMVPAFAMLLGVVAYQNIVTLPALQQAANEPRIVAVTPLRGATRGSEHQKLGASRRDGLALPVDLSGDGSFASYTFELGNPHGKTAWSGTLNAVGAGPQTVLVIPGAKLESGTYTLVIWGVSVDGTRDPAGSYVFDVSVHD